MLSARPRIIICPAMPIKMRYTEWWPFTFYTELNRMLKGQYNILLAPFGKGTIEQGKFESSTEFQKALCEWDWKLTKFVLNLNPQKQDIILLLDCTTPGMLTSMFQTYKPCKVVGFCHGTSFNVYDIFPAERNTFDKSCLGVMDTVLVASQYHHDKLISAMYRFDTNLGKPRVFNLGALPDNPNCYMSGYACAAFYERPDRVCIVDRNCKQKRVEELIVQVKKYCEVDDIHGLYDNWQDYYSALRTKYRFMLVTTREETYGYQVHDAFLCGCIPVVPDWFSFRETVPNRYRYVPTYLDSDTLSGVNAHCIPAPVHVIRRANVEGASTEPRLNGQQVSEFWNNLLRAIL